MCFCLIMHIKANKFQTKREIIKDMVEIIMYVLQ